MSKPPDKHPQGVFRTTFDGPHGGGVLVAVDGQGQAVAYATVRPTSDRQAIVQALRAIVAATEPPTPPLHLLL